MGNMQATSSSSTTVDRDLPNRRITFTRYFDAQPLRVWEAWSDARELEKWWAPKPYKAETKAFNFRPGGRWHYVMAGPNGERQWGAMEYSRIEAPRSFDATDIFTDEEGKKDPGSPETFWSVDISKSGVGTRLEIMVRGKEPGAIERILKMGFEEGLKEALNNLDNQLS